MSFYEFWFRLCLVRRVSLHRHTFYSLLPFQNYWIDHFKIIDIEKILTYVFCDKIVFSKSRKEINRMKVISLGAQSFTTRVYPFINSEHSWDMLMRTPLLTWGPSH